MTITHKRRKLFYIITTIVVALAIFRLYLPSIVTNYVNKTLSEVPDYTGSISGVNICLLKGAYRIKDMKITKRGVKSSAPLFEVPTIDLSIQWSGLKEGRIVGEIELNKPKVNIILIDAESNNSNSQTGVEVDWTEPIKELMPLEINRFTVLDGKLSYLDPVQDPSIDIFVNDLNITATNLSNITDSNEPLPSKIVATGSSIGGGKMYMTTRINLLKTIPDLDYEFKFEKISLPALNDFSDAYAALDFEGGTLDLYSEMAIKNGAIEGYFKPVINDIDLINFKEDIRNPLKLIWEGFASLMLEVFENQGRDQFATRVPYTGRIDNPETQIWPTLVNILRNAFVEAFKKQVDDTVDFEHITQSKDN